MTLNSNNILKLSFSFFLFVMVAGVTSSIKAERVENRIKANPNYLLADYHIEVTDAHGNRKEVMLRLVRKDNQVMYSSEGVHYVWDKLVNSRIKLTKYVEKIERGIEYQPSDLNSNNNNNHWQHKFQLLSDSQVLNTETIGMNSCDSRKVCKKNPEKNSQLAFQLVWLEDTKLPKEIAQKEGSVHFEWKLTKLQLSQSKVATAFEKLNSYHLIDFSDIGDAESKSGIEQLVNGDLPALLKQAIWSLDKQFDTAIAHNHHSH